MFPQLTCQFVKIHQDIPEFCILVGASYCTIAYLLENKHSLVTTLTTEAGKTDFLCIETVWFQVLNMADSE